MRDPQDLIKDVDTLPTLPGVVARINELVEDPRASAADIHDVIANDVSLSGRILKLVNSSFYGFPRKIASVTHAVVILGFNTVRTLTLSAFVFDAFKAQDLPFGFREFWIHSVGTAVAAGSLSKRLGNQDTEQAFLCGLLHDIGKIVLYQFATEEYKEVLDRVQEKDILIYDAEVEVLGVSHSEVGSLLLDRWKLPAEMIEVVRKHHTPAESNGQQQQTAVVHLADILVRAIMLGNAGDRRIPAIDPVAWQALSLSRQDMPLLLRGLHEDMHKVQAFISII